MDDFITFTDGDGNECITVDRRKGDRRVKDSEQRKKPHFGAMTMLVYTVRYESSNSSRETYQLFCTRKEAEDFLREKQEEDGDGWPRLVKHLTPKIRTIPDRRISLRRGSGEDRRKRDAV